MSFTVRQAAISDIEDLIPLFDAYRQFYGQAADIARARQFLTERFRYDQSVVFMAFDEQRRPIGFTQLYPSFSSVSAARIFILNDLFVVPGARSSGAGAALLDAAVAFARAAGAIRLSLETAVTNTRADFPRIYGLRRPSLGGSARRRACRAVICTNDRQHRDAPKDGRPAG